MRMSLVCCIGAGSCGEIRADLESCVAVVGMLTVGGDDCANGHRVHVVAIVGLVGGVVETAVVA